eukprot:GFUD01044646.1.p1 GENE.GFUD01044646.1~~GFUD01044646.1.p1  ORF type:complete len:123 (+),score=50.60 GFUD01044646.1:108-476(+)
MADEYSFASKSSLKLKGVDMPIKKKKKRKDKDREREKVEKAFSESSAEAEALAAMACGSDEDPMYKGKTPSEVAYLKKKRQREMDSIRKRANMNHKEKVEKFNSYLNKLTEHYDIPKVSWTK